MKILDEFEYIDWKEWKENFGTAFTFNLSAGQAEIATKYTAQ